jgi:hypothetical protein
MLLFNKLRFEIFFYACQIIRKNEKYREVPFSQMMWKFIIVTHDYRTFCNKTEHYMQLKWKPVVVREMMLTESNL